MDGARKALEAADGESDQPAASAAKEHEGNAKLLRTFLETFISEEFLPEVYITYRCNPSGLLFRCLIPHLIRPAPFY